ncbi:MAG TPA: ATP-binding protein [Solirubrobacteraceae bacterium]|nr:ATP-binding protein [Solirubrobacteraceae bacterium]
MPPESEHDTDLNPFDFRRPVRDAALFAGRHQLRDELGEAVDRLGARNPTHFLISGPARVGKTSVLNLVESMARLNAFVPVVLPLTDALADDPSRVLSLLVDLAYVEASEFGDAIPFPANSEKLAKDPAGLVNVLERLGKTAASNGCKGFVVLIDRAELLNDADELLQTLATLMERLDHWMFVIAGEPSFLDEIARSYAPLLTKARKWTLEVFSDQFQVLTYLYLRIREARGAVPPSQNAVADFSRASGGSPYLLAMLAHYAWDETPPLEPLALNAEAIRRTVKELRQLGLDEIGNRAEDLSTRFSRFEELADTDIEMVALLTEFEELSLAELATALCLREGCAISEIAANSAERHDALKQTLERLEEYGVLTEVDGRFDIHGGALARVFVAALAQDRGVAPHLHTGPHPTYGAYVGYELMQRMRRAVPVVQTDLPEVAGRIDVDGQNKRQGPPTWLQNFAIAAGQDDAPRMTDVGDFYAVNVPSGRGAGRAAGLVFLRLSLRVAFGTEGSFPMEETHVASLSDATGSMSNGDILAVLTEWQKSVQESLASVNVEVTQIEGVSISARTAQEYLAALAPYRIATQVSVEFANANLDGAIALIEDVLPNVQRAAMTGRYPMADNEAVGDLFSRLAFLRAVRGDAHGARDALIQARTEFEPHTAAHELSSVLLEYNGAYIRSLYKEYAASARIVRDLVGRADAPHGAFMVFATPPVTGWRPSRPTWNTAPVTSADFSAFLEAQALAYDSLSGLYSADEFAKRAESAASAAPRCSAIQRVFAWVHLGVYRDSESAVDWFGRAAVVDPESQDITEELAFARRFAKEDR